MRDAAGLPLAGAAVWADGSRRPLFVDPVRTGGDGRFRIGALPAGRVALTAAAPDGGKVEATLEGQPGQVVEWNPLFGAGLALRGRVVDDHGAPLAGWQIEAVQVDASWDRHPSTTSAEGRFVVAGLTDAPHRLQVSRRSGDPIRLVVEPVQPGGGDLVLRVTEATEPSAFVLGKVVGADGRGAPASHVTLHCEALHWSGDAEIDPGSGAFELGPLPPGEYAGRIWSTLHVDQPIEAMVLVAGERRDVGVVQVARGGDLVVDLGPPELLPSPASGRRLNLTVFDASGEEQLARCFREAAVAKPMSPLPAGRYTLGVLGSELVPQMLPFTLAEGRETLVAVHLASAASCTFDIDLGRDVPRDQWIHLRVVDASGANVLRARFRGTTVERWRPPFSAGLPAGPLTVTAVADSGHRASAELEMAGVARVVELLVR